MKRSIPWLLLIVLLVAAGAWYLLDREPTETHPSVVALPTVEEPPEPPPAQYPVEELVTAEAEPEPEPEPLPALGDSDPLVAEAAAGLIGPEALGTLFVTEQFINRLVATVDSLASRQVPALIMPIQPVPGKFQVASEGEETFIGAENADRYAPLVELLAGTDTEAMVAAYLRFYPLFQQAYEELGYQDAHFNDRVVEVIDLLLATPEPDGPLRLVKPEAVYLYADESLESLAAGQKTLLRMGPEHAARVRAKLREIRAAITAENP